MRVRTEAKRESILDTAAEVFMELGFERASMSEIANRMGGSKATLYSYFPSKEELFFEAVKRQVDAQVDPIFQALPSRAQEDPRTLLTQVSEQVMVSVTTPQAIALRRMVIAESAQSDIGQRFWKSGPQKGLDAIAAYLEAATRAGRLNVNDPAVAARHLLALTSSEFDYRWLFGVRATWTRRQIKQAVASAVDVFLAAYGLRD